MRKRRVTSTAMIRLWRTTAIETPGTMLLPHSPSTSQGPFQTTSWLRFSKRHLLCRGSSTSSVAWTRMFLATTPPSEQSCTFRKTRRSETPSASPRTLATQEMCSRPSLYQGNSVSGEPTSSLDRTLSPSALWANSDCSVAACKLPPIMTTETCAVANG